jgi:plasmid stabilization system protein ParE
MAFEIEFSVLAEQELDKVADYLDRNGFDMGILAKIKSETKRKLSETPNSAGKLAEKIPTTEKGVRQINILHKNVIYYKVERQKVVILTIRAGRMDAKF